MDTLRLTFCVHVIESCFVLFRDVQCSLMHFSLTAEEEALLLELISPAKHTQIQQNLADIAD